MTGFLDELQAAVTAAAERVGPSVIGLGRGWGRGSGVVIAEGRVLTNAHVLRGDEVAVRRPDGEVALGRVAGLDADLDVAVRRRRHRRRAGGRLGSRGRWRTCAPGSPCSRSPTPAGAGCARRSGS